jgi:hypothetical protein
MIKKLFLYFDGFSAHRALRFMPRIVQCFLLVLWITTIPEHRLFWGNDNVLFRFGMSDSMLENAFLRLYYQPEIYAWVYFTHPILLIAGLRNARFSWIPRFLGWFTGMLLYQAAPGVLGWGAVLLLQFAFLLIPVHYETDSSARKWFNSLSIAAMRIQTILVVSIIAIFMWGSAQWQKGETVYYLIHQPSEVRSFLYEASDGFGWLWKMITYSLLGMTTCLAASLLFRPTRYYSTVALLVIGSIAVLSFNNLAHGFAVITLALPWIDARESYS